MTHTHEVHMPTQLYMKIHKPERPENNTIRLAIPKWSTEAAMSDHNSGLYPAHGWLVAALFTLMTSLFHWETAYLHTDP